MKKVIALSAALAAAGAFSASAQETAPAADPATTPPAAGATDTTMPPADGSTGTGTGMNADAPGGETTTMPPATDTETDMGTDSATPPAGEMETDTTTPPAGEMGTDAPATDMETDTTTPPAGEMGTDATTAPAMDGAMEPADTATTPPADGAMTTDGATATDGAMTVPEGYTLYSGEPMTAEDLQDAAVYASDDSSVSNISDFVLAEDGAITQVIFDVGGFLGIGARNVAVPFEDLQIYTNADATDLRVYLPMTKEEMEGLPEYTEN
ncbi:PRC-barrel domain-containing protein [Cereibacter changlensis]|nr:PRC-barrel domain-containing protein [Cereibacter changlensis]